MLLSEMADPRNRPGMRRIEEADGYRLCFGSAGAVDPGAYVLFRQEDGGQWRELARGGWLPDVLGIKFGDGERVDGPAAVALPFSARCLDFRASCYRGEVRPPDWRGWRDQASGRAYGGHRAPAVTKK